MLESASDVIDALGGTNAVSEMLGHRPSAVSNYRKRGFPDRASLLRRIADECRTRGLKVAPHILPGTLSADGEAVIREGGTNFRAVGA